MEGFTKEGRMMIQVDADKYESLITAEAKLMIFANTLFMGAEASYRKDRLCFDDTTVSAVARALFPARYEQKMRELEKEEEA